MVKVEGPEVKAEQHGISLKTLALLSERIPKGFIGVDYSKSCPHSIGEPIEGAEEPRDTHKGSCSLLGDLGLTF